MYAHFYKQLLYLSYFTVYRFVDYATVNIIYQSKNSLRAHLLFIYLIKRKAVWLQVVLLLMNMENFR